MDLDDLITVLGTVADTYELAAPATYDKCIVWHRYGVSAVSGSDRTMPVSDKLQLDVLSVSDDDDLLDSVLEALENADQPYDLVDSFYDDEYAARRAIIQLEVL